ncbi:MAG TPA: DUF3810 domain-containing protein [Chitinophagaceae bacterium]|nr:DUF3810 domain-containing protein [Chitinophagaceae bacterium]
MQNTHKRWIILIVSVLFIKIFSLFPDAVEQYYSRGLYPYIAEFFRLLFGWVPFSVGDILYFIAGAVIAGKLIDFIIQLVRRRITKQIVWKKLKRFVAFLLIVYIVFNIFWGLNYNRVPLAKQLHLSRQEYSTPELSGLVQLLTDSLNAIAAYVRDDRMFDERPLFKKAVVAYAIGGKREPLLYYPYRSIKSSLYDRLLNYTGVSGYYNPFTGEAQVNTAMPGFVQPFVTCHEIGHQVGYAKEDEANFAGFLAAHAHPDTIFRYAAWFEMYAYARRELYLRDSINAKGIYQRLHPGVRADFRYMKRFYEKYENPIEPFITKIYAQYLKVNQQPRGMNTYNEVVAMLVAWYKKQGYYLQERTVAYSRPIEER